MATKSDTDDVKKRDTVETTTATKNHWLQWLKINYWSNDSIIQRFIGFEWVHNVSGKRVTWKHGLKHTIHRRQMTYHIKFHTINEKSTQHVCVLRFWFKKSQIRVRCLCFDMVIRLCTCHTRVCTISVSYFSLYTFLCVFCFKTLKMTDNSMIQHKISCRRITKNCIRFCFSRNRYQFAFTVRGTLPYTRILTLHVVQICVLKCEYLACSNGCIGVQVWFNRARWEAMIAHKHCLRNWWKRGEKITKRTENIASATKATTTRHNKFILTL